MSPSTVLVPIRKTLRVLILVLVALVVVNIYSNYTSRRDQADNSRAGCLRSTLDRFEDVLTLEAQATGDQAVSEDPEQPTRTRDARGVQADRERQTARSKITRTAATDRERRAFCARAFPPTPLIPSP